MRKRASELEWLRWFYTHADFGPADTDVREDMKRKFMQTTKQDLPEGFYDPHELTEVMHGD